MVGFIKPPSQKEGRSNKIRNFKLWLMRENFGSTLVVSAV